MPRWTPEARAKQAAIQKTRQSWRQSTGPKTAAGKARSSQNAIKYSALDREFMKLLREQARFLKRVRFYIKIQKKISSPVIPNVFEGSLDNPIKKIPPFASQPFRMTNKDKTVLPFRPIQSKNFPAKLQTCILAATSYPF